MIIAQISDFHVSFPDSGMDRRNRTADHLQAAVARLNALTPRPDVVLATGDLVEQGAVEEYARLAEILAPLTMPVLPIPGNHDERDNLRAAFPDHAHLPGTGEFLHYVVDDYAVRLVALDTVIPGASGGELCAERLAWLDQRLGEAPDRPTLVFMHHPPFVTGLAKMDTMGLRNPDDLAAVIARHLQVERIVAGHLHRPIVRRFAGTVASTCPSTAHQIALDLQPTEKLAIVMEPPAIAVHAWLPDGAGLVSHTVYVNDYSATPIFDGKDWITSPA